MSNKTHNPAKRDTGPQAISQWHEHATCLEQARPVLIEKGWHIDSIAEQAPYDTTTQDPDR